jgi:CDP-paratose 2-epimerase
LTSTPLTIYGSGLQVRDVLYVEDLLRAFEGVQANQEVTGGEIFNVGGGPDNTVSLLELIKHIEELTGEKMEFERDRLRAGDQLVYVSDTTKLNRLTGWKPETNLRGTLENMLAWYKKNRDLIASVRPIEPAITRPRAAELGRTA